MKHIQNKSVPYSNESPFLLPQVTVASEFGGNIMTGPSLPCVSGTGCCWWCNGVGNSWHTLPPNVSCASFRCHSHSEDVADHAHPIVVTIKSSNGHSKIMGPVTKHKPTWSASSPHWSPQLRDLNPVLYVRTWATLSQNVQPSNLWSTHVSVDPRCYLSAANIPLLCVSACTAMHASGSLGSFYSFIQSDLY